MSSSPLASLDTLALKESLAQRLESNSRLIAQLQEANLRLESQLATIPGNIDVKLIWEDLYEQIDDRLKEYDPKKSIRDPDVTIQARSDKRGNLKWEMIIKGQYPQASRCIPLSRINLPILRTRAYDEILNYGILERLYECVEL